jgi:hypothetical protein
VAEGAVEMLRQTRPWVVFMSVLAFVGSAFSLLLSLAMFAIGAAMPAGMKAAGGAAANIGGAMGAVYAVLGLVYLPVAGMLIYQGIKLWQYGASIGALLGSRAPVDLEEALKHQKMYWKFTGIAYIVIMALYVVFIVGAMVVGVAAGLSAAKDGTP